MSVNWKEILPGIPTTEGELKQRIRDERARFTRIDARNLMENAPREWDLKIEDPELNTGDNQALELLGSCYLRGLYLAYMTVVDTLEVHPKLRELYPEEIKRFVTTEEEIVEDLRKEQHFIEKPGEMREIFNAAAQTWRVSYVGSKATQYNKILEHCASCYLYGMNVAYDQILVLMEVDPS